MLKNGVNLSYIHNIRNYSIKIYNQLIVNYLNTKYNAIYIEIPQHSSGDCEPLLRLAVVQLTHRRVALLSYVWNAACCRYHKRDALRILARYARSIYCASMLRQKNMSDGRKC